MARVALPTQAPVAHATRGQEALTTAIRGVPGTAVPEEIGMMVLADRHIQVPAVRHMRASVVDAMQVPVVPAIQAREGRVKDVRRCASNISLAQSLPVRRRINNCQFLTQEHLVKFTMKSLVLFFGALALMNTSYADSPREQLNQMVEQLQQNPTDNALREKVIKLALELKPAPAVPEEARRHFVMAATLQKQAKTEADYDLPIQEYGKALLIAPWWSDAYYNLGIALELKRRYTEAIGNLKLSVLADPQGTGVRAAQDKIYAIEAEQEKAASAQAAAQAAKVSLDAVYAGLDGGVWQAVYMIDQAGQRWDFTGPNVLSYVYIEIHGHEMTGYYVFNPNTAVGRVNPIGRHLTTFPATAFSSRQFIISQTYGCGPSGLQPKNFETNISQDGHNITQVEKCNGENMSTKAFNRIR